MTTKATIEGYFASLKQKTGWESFLSDDMVFTSFTNPVKQITEKAAYLEATKRFYGGIVAFEVRDLLIDGDKACALTRYQLQTAPKCLRSTFESNVAEVFRVRHGKSPALPTVAASRIPVSLWETRIRPELSRCKSAPCFGNNQQ